MFFDQYSGSQQYIEDCEVCCHPVELNLRVNENMIDFFEATRVD